MWVVTLSPTVVRSITLGGTEGFLKTLKQEFSTWSFNFPPKNLAGSFNIKKYHVEAQPGGVGANLLLEYIPNDGDPTGTTVHWIQRVISNHSVTTSLHGVPEDVIDGPSTKTTPFYDDFGDATERTFHDFTYRTDRDQDHNWLAELYLVEETAPVEGRRQVNIYNGIQWGWNNEVVPEPLTIFGSGMGLGLGVLFKKYSRKENKKSQKVKTLA